MNKKTETVRIMLDFLQGPIWLTDPETGEPITGIEIIDADPIIRELNSKCSKIYNGYYEFDSHNQTCWFNYEKEKADKEIMIELIGRLISRLHEINDGSFSIEDTETPRLKKL